MSLKTTETVYNLVIEHVIKEINDDPQMSSVSTEAIEYLSRVWKNKLQESGVYTPPNNEFQKQMLNSHHVPIRPAGEYMNTQNPYPLLYAYPYAYHGSYIPDNFIRNMPENLAMFPNNYHNIVYDAKATLAPGTSNLMPQTLLQHPGAALQIQPQNPLNQAQQNKKDLAKTTVTSINIKGEEDDSNNSKLPVKVPANGGGSQVSTEVSHETPKNGPITPSQKTQDKPVIEEEEKKEVYHSENEADNEEEDVDDADLFEYNVHERTEVPQLKEEHVPPPLPGTNTGQPIVPLSVTDLDPYNPQERPLDSDDDPDYGETPETTDILIAFHEKVHRHGAKWKVTLKQGIMNAKGKEYILSQIAGDFDFM